MDDSPSLTEQESDAATDGKLKITILVNNRPVALHHKKVTGKRIKAAAEVPETFKLYDPAGREIGNDQHVEISEGERFTAISGQDVS
ncbi:MAG: multiubiquitin domain-containing protein [Solirubrobacteraceae bacterium]